MFLGYTMALDDLPVAAIERGVRSAMRQCKFMPSAVEIRELSGELSVQSRAVLAWDALNIAMRRFGAYRTVDFADRAINATVRNLGGWERVCEIPDDEFDTFFRKDFDRVYMSFARTGVGVDQGAPLVGILDRTNAFNGFPVGEPRRVLTVLPEQKRLERAGVQ